MVCQMCKCLMASNIKGTRKNKPVQLPDNGCLTIGQAMLTFLVLRQHASCKG